MHRGTGTPAPWTTLGALRSGQLFQDSAGSTCRKIVGLPTGAVLVKVLEDGAEVTLPPDFAARPVEMARPQPKKRESGR